MYFRKHNRPPNSPCSEAENGMEDLFRSKVHLLWQEGCFVDVTLACENKILKAHKLVLSAYSDYFKAIFSTVKFNQYPVIFMNDVSCDILQAILEFMYCGEVNVVQYNLNAFMKLAQTLKVKGLCEDDDEEIEQETSSGKRRKQGFMTEQMLCEDDDDRKEQETSSERRRRQGFMTKKILCEDDDDGIEQETSSERRRRQGFMTKKMLCEDDNEEEIEQETSSERRKRQGFMTKKMHCEDDNEEEIEQETSSERRRRQGFMTKKMHCEDDNEEEIEQEISSINRMRQGFRKKMLCEDDKEIEQETTSGKRRRQGFMTEKMLLTSPPLKKKRTQMQYQQGDCEDDELDQEEGETMLAHHSMDPKRQEKRFQILSSSREINNQRKRNNSFGNSSHSSQQSRISASKLPIVKSRLQMESMRKLGEKNSKENINMELANEQDISDYENMADTNMMNDDHMDDPNGSLSKFSQTSGSRNQLRLSPEPDEEEFVRTSDPIKPHVKSGKIPVTSEVQLFAEQDHEERLTKVVSYMSQITPLTCNQVKAFAWGIDSVLGKSSFGDSGPNTKWWRAFKKKYENVNKVLRSYDFLKDTNLSSKMFSFKALSDYLIPIQEIIEAFDLNGKPGNFWSCSEYSINLNGRPENCIRPSRERFLNKSHFPVDGDFVSVLLAGSASGQKISPLLVCKNISPDQDSTKDGPTNAMYERNATGFMDSVFLMKWFKNHFLPQCPKTRSEDNPIVLLLNSYFPLVTPEMLDLALTENVILLSLMPHLHHSCQPMDVPFVQGFRNFLKDKIIAEGVFSDELKEALPRLVKEPFEKGVTSEFIKTGFRICGIFPLSVNVNPDEYLDLRSQLGFDFVSTNLRKGNMETVLERPTSRKSKLIRNNVSKDATTSDEEEVIEDTNCCYVCEKEFPLEGVKKEPGKWFKCGKRHCKNYSCEECLPINYEEDSEYICIDCRG